MSGSSSDSSALSQIMDATAQPQSSQSPLPSVGSTKDTIDYPVLAKVSNWEPPGEDQNVQSLLESPGIRECALANQQPLDAQVPPQWYTMNLDETYKMILPTPPSSNLTRLQIHGVWYTQEVRKLDPRAREPAALFNEQAMTVTDWTLGGSGYCANFSLDLSGLATNSGSQGDESGRFLQFNNAPGQPVLSTTGLLVRNITAIFSQSSLGSPNVSTLQSGTPPSSDAGSTESSTPLDSSASPASRSSNQANVIVPAVVVPVVVILISGAAFFFFLWRRRRRSRMAPSAAFRADHSEAIAAAERRGAVSLGGTGTPLSPSPAPYFPLDEKRAFTP